MEIADGETARFGSDRTGLLCGYFFPAGSAGRPINTDEAASLLRDGPRSLDERFLWLHFNSANQASRRWLMDHVGLPDAFYMSLDQAIATRVELDDDCLVAVLNDVTIFGAAPTVSSMTLGVTRNLVVTARHTPLRSVDRLRDAVKTGASFRSATDLFAHFLRDQASVLVGVVRDATRQVDRIEDRLMSDHIAASRPKLGVLRRMLVRLQRLLAPEPAALFRLLHRPPAWIGADDVLELRESAEELAAAVADSVALVDRVRLLQEELLAVVNERTNRTLFILTVVTVLALPLTIIPGLFGMNVGGVPLHDAAAGFWVLIVLLVVMSAGGALYAFRNGIDL